LEARLGALVGRPGGLTAEQVAERARKTSFDVKARREEVAAAAAGVDQALVAYFPRLALSARYTRLSPVPSPILGNLVISPVATGALAPGSPLVSVPFSFPAILNQTILEATLSIPISDYILRLTQNHAGADRSRRGADLTVRATE